MSRLGPAVLTAFTLLLLTPFPTVAAAKAPAGTRHAGKHHPRATELRPRSRRRHASAVKPAPASHRTRGFRGRGGPVLAAHPSTDAARPAAIAAALATICQNTELMPTPANLELVRAAVLCLINRERAQNGEAPLVLSPQLQQAAEGHSSELVSADYFEHVSPSGVTPVDRIRDTGYIPNRNVGYVIGENLAWGTLNLATPASIVSAWIASPGHLANILETQYTDTGIGVTPQVPPSLSDGEAGATYAQEFGVIVS